MPTSIHDLPKYRLHSARGCAVVTLNGRDRYLGPYGSDASKEKYQRLIGEWLARGGVPRTPPPKPTPTPPELLTTVDEVADGYEAYARTYYRDEEGVTTHEAVAVEYALKPLRELYGSASAHKFGPLALTAVREKMIASGICRGTVNKRVHAIRRAFRWASEREMIPPSVYHGLLAVSALKHGRSAAKESDPVTPVEDAIVDATLPFLPPMLQAMVKIQRLSGMRGGELIQLRGLDIDMTGDVGKLIGYTSYLIEGGQFVKFKDAGDHLNSHVPVLDTYRRMLAAYRPFKQKFPLSKQDLLAVTSVLGG